MSWQDYPQGHFAPGILPASSGGEVADPHMYSPYFTPVPGMMYQYPVPYMVYAPQEPRTSPQELQVLLRRLEALNLRENQLVQQLKTIDTTGSTSATPETATEELRKLAFERYQMVARLSTPPQPSMDASSSSSTASSPPSRSSTPGPSGDGSTGAGWVSPQAAAQSFSSDSSSTSPKTSPRVGGLLVIPPLRLPFGYDNVHSSMSSPKTPSMTSPIPHINPSDLLRLEKPSFQQTTSGKLLPRMVVRINLPALTATGCHDLSTLTVQCVALSNDDTPVSPTSRAELLEGTTVVSVEADGSATFGALRFTEPAAKYNSVVLYFHLFKNDAVIGRTQIGQAVRSNAVTVQSRLNKRKRGSFLGNPPPAPDGERASSPMPQMRASKLRPTSPPPPDSSAYPVNGSPDSIFVDITDLLALPQKEAATKLGISESMLCKRFKECTRRKWPYRYLRKIDKQISALQSTQGGLSPDDQSRLDALLLEREECLCPVKIRITNHDKALGSLSVSSSTLAASTSSMPLSPSSSILPPDEVSPRSAYDGLSPRSDSSSEPEDEDMNYESVIETLEMLRNSSTSPGPISPSPKQAQVQLALLQQQ